MHRIKKILIYLSIFMGFIFCFLFGKYINTLAVTNIDNTLGSYPVQIDINNYNNDNLIGFNDQEITLNGYNVKIENGIITTSGTASANTIISVYFIQEITLKGNTNYYYSLFNSPNGRGNIAIPTINDLGLGWDSNLERSIKVLQNQNINRITLYCSSGTTCNNTIKPVLKTENYADEFISFFKFGFNVDLVVNNPGNSNYNSVNGTLNINTKINDFICYNSSYSISASTTYYRLNNICFIPFNINPKGYISLNEINLNTTFSSSNISLFQGESGYILTPYLSGYYKGELVDNVIYLKNSYLSNSFYLNGFTARISGNNDAKLTSVGIRPYNDNEPADEVFGLTEENQNFNFISELVTEVKFYNSININENLNFQLGLTYGQFQNINEISTLNYVFSLSGINSIVINDISATSPLPDNELTNNKYNTCSAWYDIPCQLGNAVTYVIYEAPIISPIINFFDSFVDLIGSLVTYITWFEGLGLIFGVFIVIFFIRMIILLVKGGNDD